MLNSGDRVSSPNGNPGTVVGNMNASGSIVAIKLDNGRQVSALASLCSSIPTECGSTMTSGPRYGHVNGHGHFKDGGCDSEPYAGNVTGECEFCFILGSLGPCDKHG